MGIKNQQEELIYRLILRINSLLPHEGSATGADAWLSIKVTF